MSNYALMNPAVLTSPQMRQRLLEVVGAGQHDDPADVINTVLTYLSGIADGTSSVTPPLAALIGYEAGPDFDSRDPYAAEVIVRLVSRAIAEGFSAEWDSPTEVTLVKPTDDITGYAILLSESPQGSIVVGSVKVPGGRFMIDNAHLAENVSTSARGDYDADAASAWSYIRPYLA